MSKREPLGHHMRAEMFEQPGALRRFALRRNEHVARLRAALPDRPRGLLLVARGSSDQAAQFGRYLCEIYAGVPVSLAAASVHTRYHRRMDLTGWVLVAVSQSGGTPEIVDVLSRSRAAGARTVAITNDEASPLAQVADVPLVLGVGLERAVPATKTFTTSMLAMAHVVASLTELPWDVDVEQQMADVVDQVLSDESAVTELVEECLVRRPIHIGRSFTYSVALEGALKFKETTGRPAEAYASGDLLHGPVAAVGADNVVVGYAASGPVFDDVVETVLAAREREARAFVVADDVRLPADVRTVAVPAGLPEPMSALPLVVRAQQLALMGAIRSGVDPDRPGGLRKVTATA